MASLADLKWYLSGAGNTNPANSLGGGIGQAFTSQTVTGFAVSGYGLSSAEGNPPGIGTLTYNNTDQTMTWAAPGDTEGPATPVSVNGLHVIHSATFGYLVVNKTGAGTPGSVIVQSLTVEPNLNNLFDDISKDESYAGSVDYRCFYIWNTNPTDTLITAAVYVQSQPSGADSVEIGLDPAGVNDGSASAVTIADESTAPAGVTFSAPSDSASALSIGDLPPDQGIAIWVKRTVPANTLAGTPQDIVQLAVEVRF